MEESKIIEINGIKMEVDLREGKVRKVDAFRVGDPVKILKKEYSGHNIHYGVIVGFENFESLPTIVVLYLSFDSVKTAYINAKSETELVASGPHDLLSEKTWILEKMQKRVDEAELKLEQEKMNLRIFQEQFGKFFNRQADEVINESV